MNLKKTFILLISLVFLFENNQSSDFVSIMNGSFNPSNYYYIQTSPKLSEGILFTNSTGSQENVQYPLLAGTSNNNAVWNYNKSSGRTEYSIYVYAYQSQVDICHGAKNHLCSNYNCTGNDNYLIPIENVKWSVSSINELNSPSLQDAFSLQIGFRKILFNIISPQTFYFRYWLDVPPNSPALSYNTTYQIMVVASFYEC